LARDFGLLTTFKRAKKKTKNMKSQRSVGAGATSRCRDIPSVRGFPPDLFRSKATTLSTIFFLTRFFTLMLKYFSVAPPDRNDGGFGKHRLDLDEPGCRRHSNRPDGGTMSFTAH